MDNREMSGIIARNVHGWQWHESFLGLESLGGAWVSGVGGFQHLVENYNPAENVAQAFEAAEVWRKKNSNTFWDVCSPLDDEGWDCTIYVRDFPAEGIHAVADTPALAITEALVKTVSDE